MVEYRNTNPWYYAVQNKRDYITPEDITEAINAGAEKLELWGNVLDALSMGQCEDYSLCAFIAHRYI